MSSELARRSPHRLLNAALFIGLAATLPGMAQAARVDYEVGASFLRSDNLNLSENAEIGENVLSPFLRFNAEQSGSTLELKLRGSVQYIDYFGNDFADEWRGDLTGEANWTIVPERVDFVFQDFLTRQPVNVLNAFSPANQQQVNVFVLGPTFRARFGDATRGQLDLRYSDTYAEDGDTFNGDRYNVAGRLVRELSDAKRLSGNIEATRVDYSFGNVSDYTRYDAYLGYTSTSKSLDFGIEAGYSRLRPRDTGNDTGAPLLRANLDWRIAARSTLTGELSYQFADSAQNLAARADRVQTPIIGNAPDTNIQTGPDVYRQRRLDVGYLFGEERLKFQLQPFYQRVRYVDSIGLDQSIRGGFLTVSYKVRPRLTFLFTASTEKRKFDNQSREDDDSFLNIGILNQFTRHWSGRIDLQRRSRDSSAAGQSYDENAAIVSFAYRR